MAGRFPRNGYTDFVGRQDELTGIAALLSKQAGRPVQLMLDREAENLAAGNRNPTRQRVRLGARQRATLLEQRVLGSIDRPHRHVTGA